MPPSTPSEEAQTESPGRWIPPTPRIKDAAAMSNIIYRPAHELARMICDGEVTSLDVVNAFLEQISRHNEKLNAIITLDADGARARAVEADEALQRGEAWGPLHGVPVTIKDMLETKGMRTTSGYAPLANHIPNRDATVVKRLREAGAIILGKTNMPETGADIQTNNRLFGRTNNPWDVTRTAGGSSGGEAAALAAGMTPLGIGSDLAGSIRIPAHFCGVMGLRTTDRLISRYGLISDRKGTPRATRYMSVNGPMARTVADLRLALKVIAGPDGLDPEVAPSPLANPTPKPISQLRIAWTDDIDGVPVTRETKTALASLVSELEAAGAQVEYTAPDLDYSLVWKTYGVLLAFVIGPRLLGAERVGFRMMGPVMFRDKIMRATAYAADMDVSKYLEALVDRDAIFAQLERFLSQYDAWLLPVSSRPAFQHCKGAPTGTAIPIDGERIPYWTANISYTALFNLCGNPVVTLPMGYSQTYKGMPIGVQIAGNNWDDMALLNVAESIEAITGGFRAPPGYMPE